MKDQLISLSNRMNGGYPRWQSQNIKRLVIPNLVAMSERWKRRMVDAYLSDDFETIDNLMTLECIKSEYQQSMALTLFEPSPTAYTK